MALQHIIRDLNEKLGFTDAQAASAASMDLRYYQNIISGQIRPNFNDATALSELYKIPSSIFLMEPTTATHLNFASGSYSNSNHGYINQVVYNADSSLKEILKELLVKK